MFLDYSHIFLEAILGILRIFLYQGVFCSPSDPILFCEEEIATG